MIKPDYYKVNVEFEVDYLIKLFVGKLDGIEAFYLGNVIKYLYRAEKKNGLEDYKKALTYLEKMKIKGGWYFISEGQEKFIEQSAKNLPPQIQECVVDIICGCFVIAKEKLEKYIKEKENVR